MPAVIDCDSLSRNEAVPAKLFIDFQICSCYMKPVGKSPGQELYNTLKGAANFTCKAAKEKGRILILGDQGVNRSAAVAMAFLMQDRNCTLEDAFYYVKSLRPAVQPAPQHLEALAKYEAELFGKKITPVEDLW